MGEHLQCACRVPVTTPGGEHFWYSPLHRSVVWKVPAAPWGGFLAEEMVSIQSHSTWTAHCSCTPSLTDFTQGLSLWKMRLGHAGASAM